MINALPALDKKGASETRSPVAAEVFNLTVEAKHWCLIVDEGTSSLEKLRMFVENSEEFDLLQEIRSEIDVPAVVRRERPDVLVINVDVLHGSIKELLSSLRDDTYAPAIVLVSACGDFAAEAFALGVSDYLLRPLSLERLEACFKRVYEQLSLRRLSAQFQNGTAKTDGAFKDELLLRTSGRIVFAHPSEIKYISAERNYVRFHLRSESILIRGAISRVALSLNRKLFLRIHRSAIVNIRFIKEMRPWSESGTGRVVLRDGTTLRTGRTYMTEMLKTVELR
ncbi:MAG: hypothetical protein DMG62_22155 [Acidobacteria bacterium]|nr:MAG: hypothetical protein DMG62_22155 [Acidobacteriota bacterium]